MYSFLFIYFSGIYIRFGIVTDKSRRESVPNGTMQDIERDGAMFKQSPEFIFFFNFFLVVCRKSINSRGWRGVVVTVESCINALYTISRPDRCIFVYTEHTCSRSIRNRVHDRMNGCSTIQYNM